MKSIITRISFLTVLASISFLSFGQPIKVDCDGDVGIGTDPGSYRLNVSGYAYFTPTASYHLLLDASGYYGTACLRPTSNNSSNIGTSSYAYAQMWSYSYGNPSDVRQKENIRSINDALDIVLQLEGVRYDYKKDYAYNDSLVKDENLKAKLETQRKNKIGFIAQEVYNVLPEVVIYDDSTDVYGIDYSKVVPVLVNAIKEQQAQIDSLKQLIIMSSGTLKSTELTTNIENSRNSSDKPYLEQNSPNPFSNTTTINYYIPKNNQKAAIYVYDMQGLQKKVYTITEKGKSDIIINSFELNAGMYLYTLIVDGTEVDTKRMILTD
jgi:hypothetical protein